MKKKTTHGGARKGAGRPATGRRVTNKTITMANEIWGRLDELRGEKTRSVWISDKIKKTKGGE